MMQWALFLNILSIQYNSSGLQCLQYIDVLLILCVYSGRGFPLSEPGVSFSPHYRKDSLKQLPFFHFLHSKKSTLCLIPLVRPRNEYWLQKKGDVKES